MGKQITLWIACGAVQYKLFPGDHTMCAPSQTNPCPNWSFFRSDYRATTFGWSDFLMDRKLALRETTLYKATHLVKSGMCLSSLLTAPWFNFVFILISRFKQLLMTQADKFSAEEVRPIFFDVLLSALFPTFPI